jgi:hypothetical protein
MSADDEDFDDELGVAAGFVLAFTVGFVTVLVVGAAIAWNAVSVVAETVQAVRDKL